MYDRHTFRMMKHDLVYSHTHSPADPARKAEVNFLRHLLSTCAISGALEERDVERAIESSGILDLEGHDKREALLWARYWASWYLGRLSPEQKRILRQLRDLCASFTDEGSLAALREIADTLD
jgi:hypothetical protein